MNHTYTITESDIIMADIYWNGKSMARCSTTGFTSISQVAKMMKTMAGNCFGRATLYIRNKTQGWTISTIISTPNQIKLKKYTSSFFAQHRQRAFATQI